MQITTQIFESYQAAGGDRSFVELFDPLRGLVSIQWDGKRATVRKWDASLTAMGLVRPNDDDLTRQLRAFIEAAS